MQIILIKTQIANLDIVIEIDNLTGNEITTFFKKDVKQGVMYNAELNTKYLIEGVCSMDL